ncbi:TIM44-like domain-containing protein [Pseudodesulfovibrio pelocollis]|uniref:TIM44-like domain-containing protein n=1 Tax=Pseudodesulfovibrio pelocollis TaxID=3051432 RepID=UPI00255B1D7D|nr:TIM44-like domain-containing protein [Pseudodesulfovibrio sp. SB368]
MSALAILLWAVPALAAEPPQGGGGSILNILFLGLIAYFLVRAFRRRGGGGSGPGRGSGDDDQSTRDDSPRPPGKPMDRHEAARQMWSMLGSGDAAQNTPVAGRPGPEPGGFDAAEFLEGAKLFFSRFQQVSGGRDLEELRGFLSEDVYEQTLAALPADAALARTEVMLVDARLVERKSEGGRTWVTVFYDAQLRRGVSGEQPYTLRTAWEFSRAEGAENGLWTLEKINKMDQ